MQNGVAIETVCVVVKGYILALFYVAIGGNIICREEGKRATTL